MVAFVASTVLTAANLNTAFNALTIRTVTLTSDTLVLADNGGAVTYSNASATTSTIPPNSSVAYAVGTKIVLANLGAGVVTVTAGSGVTVGGTLTIAQDAGGTCLKTATNTWSFLPFGSAGAATLTSADVTSTTGSPTLTTSGIYTIYSFTASGTIVLGKAGLCDAVVLGGAGAGGKVVSASWFSAGGGGAGGYLEITNAYVPSGTHTITVGAGGAGSATVNAVTNGNASRIGGLYYGIFGGFGAGINTTGEGYPASNGGSGGGGYASSGVGGPKTGVAGQGNTGGNGDVTVSGGGGGGAGAVGGNFVSTTGGAGGAGTASSITGSSVTRGGGGGGSGTAGGAAGSGGGGAGGAGAGNGAAGSTNLGGGGGGAGAGGTSGNGGSGVVIIRVVT